MNGIGKTAVVVMPLFWGVAVVCAIVGLGGEIYAAVVFGGVTFAAMCLLMDIRRKLGDD